MKKKNIDLLSTTNDLFDALISQSKFYRRVIVFLLALLTSSLLVNGYLIIKKQFIPVYIPVKEGGEVLKNFSSGDNNQREVNSILNSVVLNYASVPLTVKQYNEQFFKNRYFLTQTSQKKLNELLRESAISLAIKNHMTTSVLINSITKISGTESSYEVEYEVKFYESGGALKEKIRYVATFAIAQVTFNSREAVLNNPYQLVIEDLSISEKIGSEA